ncbi:MAG: thioredoxin family protein [Steroidobacteraceae bacterium]
MQSTVEAKRLPSLQSVMSILPLLLVLLCHAAAAASDRAATAQVQARLVASVTAVKPGEQILLGVQQQIIPHWHTYWLNPGDSGTATSIDWSLPAGASAGPIQWPVPQRFTLGPITNYGYADEVTLLSTVSVPQNATVGSEFPIEATVDWLVCEAECIPQQVTLGMTLPVIAPAGTRADSATRDLIAAAQVRLPVASPWNASVESEKGRTTLRLREAQFDDARIKDLWFYPSEWGVAAHGAAQPRQIDGKDVTIQLQPGDSPLAAGRPLEGVLVVSEDTGAGVITRGFTITAAPANAAIASETSPASSVSFLSAVLFAFVGGLILNLMPCVFPVLSMKALSLLAHAEHSAAQARWQGIAYTAGVLASFAALSVLLLALRAGGAQLGWGFQFQSPLFVLAMAYLMFAVGLSLSGVFYLGGSMVGIGGALADKPGYTGSFFTGVLATLVATPCTAPFMGAAIGYALSQPAIAVLIIFLSLGFGLAVPYLLLSTWPALQRRLPRPGVWMERVKQALAFPMYAAAVWLVWVLAMQAGSDAIVVALGGMVAIAFGAWLFQTTRNRGRSGRSLGTAVAAAAVAGALVAGYVGLTNRAAAPQVASASSTWEPYSSERLDALRAKGEPVFLNFTAAWCITCLANERVALSTDAVKQAFAASGIVYLKGDWTHQDEHITRALTQFGRSGVPLYVFYPAGRDSAPVVLPQILTPDIVLNTIGADGALLASTSHPN